MKVAFHIDSIPINTRRDRMLRIYYIQPVHKTNPYAAFKQPEKRVHTQIQTKRSSVGLSFSQHLELVESLIKQ